MNIICNDSLALWQYDLDWRDLAASLEKMANVLFEYGRKAGEIELYLVSDAEIARLNWKFLGCKGPTNVLGFPGKGDMPGCLFVSSKTLLREAALYGQDRDCHLLRMLAHGICHLAGMDHGPEMERMTELCLTSAKGLHKDNNP